MKRLTYARAGKAETFKTVGTLIIESLGYYDNNISRKIGKWLRNQPYEEGMDYNFIQMPDPIGNGKIIGAKAWRSHCWGEIKEKIENVKELL